MVLSIAIVGATRESLGLPDLNGVIGCRIGRRAVPGDHLIRGVGGDAVADGLPTLGLLLRGLRNLRHGADDGEGVGHPLALQDIVAVRFWREDNVLVTDGHGDLHLSAFCGLHRELQVLAEGRDQLAAVAVLGALISDRRVDELKLDLNLRSLGLIGRVFGCVI